MAFSLLVAQINQLNHPWFIIFSHLLYPSSINSLNWFIWKPAASLTPTTITLGSQLYPDHFCSSFHFTLLQSIFHRTARKILLETPIWTSVTPSTTSCSHSEGLIVGLKPKVVTWLQACMIQTQFPPQHYILCSLWIPPLQTYWLPATHGHSSDTRLWTFRPTRISSPQTSSSLFFVPFGSQLNGKFREALPSHPTSTSRITSPPLFSSHNFSFSIT